MPVLRPPVPDPLVAVTPAALEVPPVEEPPTELLVALLWPPLLLAPAVPLSPPLALVPPVLVFPPVVLWPVLAELLAVVPPGLLFPPLEVDPAELLSPPLDATPPLLPPDELWLLEVLPPLVWLPPVCDPPLLPPLSPFEQDMAPAVRLKTSITRTGYFMGGPPGFDGDSGRCASPPSAEVDKRGFAFRFKKKANPKACRSFLKGGTPPARPPWKRRELSRQLLTSSALASAPSGAGLPSRILRRRGWASERP
jgi:hypothetical protein